MAIIGAGITGALVVVLDRRDLAAGSTAATTGLLHCSQRSGSQGSKLT